MTNQLSNHPEAPKPQPANQTSDKDKVKQEFEGDIWIYQLDFSDEAKKRFTIAWNYIRMKSAKWPIDLPLPDDAKIIQVKDYAFIKNPELGSVPYIFQIIVWKDSQDMDTGAIRIDEYGQVMFYEPVNWAIQTADMVRNMWLKNIPSGIVYSKDPEVRQNLEAIRGNIIKKIVFPSNIPVTSWPFNNEDVTVNFLETNAQGKLVFVLRWQWKDGKDKTIKATLDWKIID